MYRNLHGDINIYGTSAPASILTARTVFSQVNAHPRFLAVNFKRPCTLTRENAVHDMYTQMKL